MRIAVIVLIGLGLIGGATAYRYETEEVTVKSKCEIRCPWSGHQGSTLLRTKTTEVVIPRWHARSVGVQTESEICPACKTRKEKEERIARVRAAAEERKAKVKAETDRIMQNLEVQFAVVTFWRVVQWDDPYTNTDQKAFPGQEIFFVFLFKNNSQKPIPEGEIRAIVRPAENLVLRDSPDINLQAAKTLIRKISTRGFAVGQIKPYNSPYFAGENNVAAFKIFDLHDFSERVPYFSVLHLDSKTPSGQSIQFSGLIAVKGHEIPIATRTVNVMYK